MAQRSIAPGAIFSSTQGLLVHAIVHAADLQDRNGGVLVMATLFSLYPFLLKFHADGGYQGAGFQNAVGTILKGLNVDADGWPRIGNALIERRSPSLR
jgi:hypothetical protein